MTQTQRALLFVYNADSGVGSALLDIGHKIISPSTYNCRLCALTHGVFAMRESWRVFVKELPLPAEFLHRDAFRSRYDLPGIALPAVLGSVRERRKLLGLRWILAGEARIGGSTTDASA
jgi:hypothetical protein